MVEVQVPTDKSKTPLILIAEDDENLMKAYLRIVKPLTEAAGASLWVETENPNNFVRAAHEMREYAKVMLITDGEMPYMRGPDLIRALHEKLGDKLTKRVLVSGSLDPEMLTEVLGLNVEALSKVSAMPSLVDIVKEFLKEGS